ncbi:MurR/RpiR family transcriptional regulator [Neobacillus cucumis]|uniref:MurR/RpiR family transcriptional regulator n=1 Tax=Neobacillus cucumis TaxID=1740721 RepID=UPI00285372A7|nr:MurR/RpiR family transcriptional regulator [Neobacillus cucumis]MDR4945617.1 MurR/RpiR family transcriptional regulator [Neobacillus cucumis]
MTNNCFNKIRSYYPRFSEKEKQIADYILKNPEKIVHGTINEVAEDLGVADATVFRFCKRIGFKGYQAMKIALASETIIPRKEIHEEITEEDNEQEITEKVFKSNIQTMENTLQLLDRVTIKKAVELISTADKVHFFGTGGSSIIAMDAFHKFVRTGVKAYAFTDSHFQLMAASQLTPRDLAVVISHSGTNSDTINILNVALENGAKTIGITSFPKSPISQKADVVLLTSSEETKYRSEALASRIAQLSIIDVLYVNIMIKNKEVSQESLEKVRKAILKTKI